MRGGRGVGGLRGSIGIREMVWERVGLRTWIIKGFERVEGGWGCAELGV
jgi:hypothetical protein